MFGQKSAFGGGTTGGGFGGFGNASTGATSGGGAFGTTSAFGQPGAPAAAPAFGGFGSTPTTSTGLFTNPGAGTSNQGLFGQSGPPGGGTAFGGFGTSSSLGATANSTFGGSGGTNAFAKPQGFGAPFGSAPAAGAGGSLFGSPAVAATSAAPGGSLFGATSSFGATSTTTSSFGSFGASSFGAGAQQQSGTALKFNPPSGSDTMLKSGITHNISTRHQCISCMKEYEAKSLEELRFEDYAAGRKGGSAAPGGAMGLFGQQQSNPGQQPAQQGTSLFGAQPTSQGGSVFGSTPQQPQQNKPLFGASTSTAFGAGNTFGTSNAFGQTPAAAGGGLFKPPNAFGAATTAPSASFGFNTATSTAGTSLFGQQNKPAFGQPTQAAGGIFGAGGATTTGFGAPAASTAPAFGQTAAAPAFGQQTTGLFGQSAAAKPTGFGTPTSGFGASNTGFGGFGATSTAPAGFGQAAKPAFGFGQSTAPTASTATPSFGFGAAAPASSGSLFGQKPANSSFSFGTAQPAAGFGAGTTAFGASTGGGLFGSTQNKPGGLFGSTPGAGSAFGATTSGFGAPSFSLGGNAGSAFGGGLGSTASVPGGMQPYGSNVVSGVAPSNIIHQSLASLSANPYGENSLFKKMLQSSGKREEIIKPSNPSTQKALNADSATHKLSPHRNVKAKAKPLLGSGKKSSMFDGLEDDDIHPKNEIFVPRSSVKKLVLKPKNSSHGTPHAAANTNAGGSPEEENGLSLTVPLHKSSAPEEPSFALSPIIPSGGGPSNNISLVDESFTALNTRNKVPRSKNNLDASVFEDGPGEEAEESPAGIVLRRNGYYTIPALSEMGSLVDAEGNCLIEGFTIGRNGYGNIYFPGVINVAGMNFDEIVFIRHKEVIVYPDDDKKPPYGEGLNRKAQVTLDKVWPVDKAKRQPLTDPERLLAINYEDKLEKASIKLGARFVEYRPETGSWVFKVDHFSKYGLDDSDEEDVAPPLIVKTSLDPNKKLKTLQLEMRDAKTQQNGVTANTLVANLNEANLVQHAGGGEELLNRSMEDNSQSPPNQQINNKVQRMKASLFDEDEEDLDSEMMDESLQPKGRPVILEQRTPSEAPTEKFIMEDVLSHSRGLGGSFALDQSGSSSLLRSQFLSQLAATKKEVNQQLTNKNNTANYSLTQGYEHFVTLPTVGSGGERPRTVVPRFYSKVPYEDSLLFREFNLADAGSFMNRSFRCGWGPQWRIANCGASFDGLTDASSFDVSVEGLRNTRGGEEEMSCLEAWLNVSLSNSEVSSEEGVPIIASRPETLQSFVVEANRQYGLFDSAATEFAKELKRSKEVWSLCDALWGDLEGEDGNSHNVTMLRREALSSWLRLAISSSENNEGMDAKGMEQVLDHLSANRVVSACDASHEEGNHFSALLMSQFGCGVPGSLLFNQMDRWQEAHADRFMDKDTLRFYALAAGNPVWPASDGQTINTCEGLDWRRAFAYHLWYLCSPVASISDALTLFNNAFEGHTEFGVYASAPHPPHSVESFHITYHLLRLYCDRSHSLEALLSPASHSGDPLDFRLSWLVNQALLTLGYKHLCPVRQDDLTASFASQLENAGLWNWAVYVLLHLSSSARRESLVRDVLCRGVRHCGDTEEDFLLERLGVPREWIADAKATLAAAGRQHDDTAWFLLKAARWNQAHDVLTRRIAPDAIINEDTAFLHKVLCELSQREAHVNGWGLSGEIFLDFLNVERDVKEALGGVGRGEEDLAVYLTRELKPQVISLCGRISKLRTASAKERLCQSEIAKRMAGLMRAVLCADATHGNKASRILAETLCLLPLPDDYALQELRNLTKNYMLEIMET